MKESIGLGSTKPIGPNEFLSLRKNRTSIPTAPFVQQQQFGSAGPKIFSLGAVLLNEYASNAFGLADPQMKQPITIRLDPELLAAARICAKEENRTLTNFLETALKERFNASEVSRTTGQSFGGRKIGRGSNFKRSSDAKS